MTGEAKRMNEERAAHEAAPAFKVQLVPLPALQASVGLELEPGYALHSWRVAGPATMAVLWAKMPYNSAAALASMLFDITSKGDRP